MATWNEYFTSEQLAKKEFGFAFGTTGRFPLVKQRIWGTLADLQNWVSDSSTDSTACAGLVVTVVNDSDASKNGVYFVKSAAGADGATEGVLVKLGASSSADSVKDAVDNLQATLGVSSKSGLTEALKETNYLSDSGQVATVTQAIVALDSALQAVSASIPTDFSQYATTGQLETAKEELSGYTDTKAEEASASVKSWVEEQGYITGADLSNYATTAQLASVSATITGDVATVSGAVTALTEDVKTISGSVTALTEDVKTISGSVTALTEDVTAISASVTSITASLESNFVTTGDLETAKEEVSGVVTAWVETQKYVQEYVINGQTGSSETNVTLDTDDIKVGDYTATTYNEQFTGATPVATDQTVGEAIKAVESTVANLANEVVDNSNSVTALTTALGITGDTIEYKAVTNANYISGATSYADADKKLDEAIKSVSDTVNKLVIGTVTSVSAGDDTVTVSGTSAVTVSVNSQNLDIVGADAITVTKQADNSGLDVKLKISTASTGVSLSQDSEGLSAKVEWEEF